MLTELDRAILVELSMASADAFQIAGDLNVAGHSVPTAKVAGRLVSLRRRGFASTLFRGACAFMWGITDEGRKALAKPE